MKMGHNRNSPRGKLTAVTASIKIEEGSQVNSLTSYLKELAKKKKKKKE